MDDPGQVYRDAKAALNTARKQWADAETEHGRRALAERARLGEHRCSDECIADVVAGHDAVQFAKACIVAAGEQVKGITFDEAMAANQERPEMPLEV